MRRTGSGAVSGTTTEQTSPSAAPEPKTRANANSRTQSDIRAARSSDTSKRTDEHTHVVEHMSCARLVPRLPGHPMAWRTGNSTIPQEPLLTRRTTMGEHPPAQKPVDAHRGWYPDPDNEDSAENKVRWWNGTQWTAYLAPTERASPPKPQPATQRKRSHCCGAAVRRQRHRATFRVCFWVGFFSVLLSWVVLPFLPKQYYCRRCRRSCRWSTHDTGPVDNNPAN